MSDSGRNGPASLARSTALERAERALKALPKSEP
jgi:hypothetical protein